MIIDEDVYLEHYGTPRHSGRYPWGSGGNSEKLGELPRNLSFLDAVTWLRKNGLKDTEIVEGMGLQSTTQLRAMYSRAKNDHHQSQVTLAQSLHDKGYSNTAAAQRMGIPESTFRSLIAPGVAERADNLNQIANMLKDRVAQHTYVDVGSGNERFIGVNGVSQQKLAVAVQILKEEGYQVHDVPITQQGTGLNTRGKILVPPGVTQRQTWENRDKIHQLVEFSPDDGRTFGITHPPISINPNRVKVVYGSEGGNKADGVIYVRPGIDDISLGSNQYAQVRVLVGEGHYLKGMAMYKDDLPKGTDLVFNTAKESTGNKLDAMKEIKADPEFPFGSVVRQITADTNTPHERVTSAMNIVTEEGKWAEWNKNLSAQMLSKQSRGLIKQQLDTTFDRRKKELEQINSLTNPVVRKKLLDSFADESDSAAVHLKAAALPRSAWHAILPIESLKPTEVYAPGYNNGEIVALIRYPHAGTFEIPNVTVNNKNREARKLLGNAPDVIGIHHETAKHLSGADFDGDAVLVVPNNSGKIKVDRALEGLKHFDPVHEYPGYEGMPKINKQLQMGNVSNLITDMTLRGAPNEEIVRAVRHSMVVIDAEKHNLNWKESERQNGIAALKKKYQGGANKGASTLISRKKQTEDIPDRKERPVFQGGKIDPKTGRKVFVETGATRRLADGTRVPKTIKVKKLELTDDAHTLSSGTIKEALYADHSNRLKELANQARLASLNTPRLKRSSSAAKVYAREVSSLKSKLALVEMNRPRERQAQIIAAVAIKTRLDAHPDLDKSSKDKIRFAEQEKARIRMGAKQNKVQFTQEEWNAIQAGAVSHNLLEKLLAKADMESVRKLATPKRELLLSPADANRAKALLSSGKDRAEVAAILGVSLSTLDRATGG